MNASTKAHKGNERKKDENVLNQSEFGGHFVSSAVCISLHNNYYAGFVPK